MMSLIKARLTPSPCPSPGLLDATVDVRGGAWIEAQKRGNYDAAVYTVDGLNQITVLAADGGGLVTYVRGVWKAATVFRHSAFMAPVDPASADTANYLTAAVNQAGQTVITVPAGLVGQQVQVYYIHRTTDRTLQGEGVGGYPHIHRSKDGGDYGTANDGDNSVIAALYQLHEQTADLKYKNLADRMLAAMIEWGALTPGKVVFDIPIAAAESGYGLYAYKGNNATLDYGVEPIADASGGMGLRLKATLPGAPDYGYAGFGLWPSMPITVDEPVSSIDIEMFGDGTGRRLLVRIQTDPGGSSGGKVYAGLPMLPADGKQTVKYSFTQAQFWKLANIVYNADRCKAHYETVYGDDANAAVYAVSDHLENNTGPEGPQRYYVRDLAYSIPAAAWGVGVAEGIDAAAKPSTGTTALKMALYSDIAANVTVKVVDNAATTFSTVVAAVAGWQAVSIPWGTFGAVVHPIAAVKVEVRNPGTAGVVRFDNIRFDDVITMASLSPTIVGGVQIAFNDYGTFDIFCRSIEVVQTIINPYPDLPRWTYKWNKVSGYFGHGAWRGPIAPGYLWMGGWTLSDVKHPGTATAISTTMRNFMKAAQDAYTAAFPAATPGPFMPRYGAPSWEAVDTGHLRQFYFDGATEWHGYEFRALLSVARDYYISRHATSKAILDVWMAWIAAKVTYNAGNGNCAAPVGFNNDGTLDYSYTSIYGHICIASACILKYWVDADATALIWYRRLIDDLHNRWRITSTGYVQGFHVTEGGQNYSATPTVGVTDSSAPPKTATGTATVAGGIITRIAVGATDQGMVAPLTVQIADATGTGAAATAYLIDDLVGAYSTEPTGWEHAELGNLLAMLVIGDRPGGTVKYPLAPTAADIAAFTGLHALYVRTARDVRPSMMTADYLPLHEFTWSSWHHGNSLENPVNRDTHIDGALWTETLGPTLAFAAEWARYSGDHSWVDTLYAYITELAGWIVVPSNVTGYLRFVNADREERLIPLDANGDLPFTKADGTLTVIPMGVA